MYIECGVFLDSTIQDFLEFSVYIGFKYLSAVLGAPDNMVLVLIGGVVKFTYPHVDKDSTFRNRVLQSKSPPSQGGL